MGFSSSTMDSTFIVTLFGALGVIAGAQQQGAVEVSVWPPAPVVEYGGSVELNCTTTCQDPDMDGGLETSLTKRSIGNGPGWQAYRLVDITEWGSLPQCYFKCYGKTEYALAKAVVYQAPEHVILEPLPMMEVGRDYNLTCRVLNVAPIQNLTVTLRRGVETLHTETFPNHTVASAANVTVTHVITAQKWEREEEVTCHAVLAVLPHDQPIASASLGVGLKTFAFPVDPQLHVSLLIETDTNTTVRCQVAGVFPSTEVQFNLSWAGESLNSTVRAQGDTVTREAQVASSTAGEQELTCTAMLGPVARSAVKTVRFYTLPQPKLVISPAETALHENVTLTCDSPGVQAPNLSLWIRNANRTLASGHERPLNFTLAAHEEDDGREFVCEVMTSAKGRTVRKTAFANLTVRYGPKMDTTTCPGNWTWEEGTEQTLSCTARGNPMPSVECVKDSVPLKIGVSQRITRELTGTYRCTATNDRGSAVQDVSIRVQYTDPDIFLIILLTLTIAGILATIAVVCYIYYRAHKIQKYKLQKAHRNQDQEMKCLNGGDTTKVD